jgi:hypothetical protein
MRVSPLGLDEPGIGPTLSKSNGESISLPKPSLQEPVVEIILAPEIDVQAIMCIATLEIDMQEIGEGTSFSEPGSCERCASSVELGSQTRCDRCGSSRWHPMRDRGSWQSTEPALGAWRRIVIRRASSGGATVWYPESLHLPGFPVLGGRRVLQLSDTTVAIGGIGERRVMQLSEAIATEDRQIVLDPPPAVTADGSGEPADLQPSESVRGSLSTVTVDGTGEPAAKGWQDVAILSPLVKFEDTGELASLDAADSSRAVLLQDIGETAMTEPDELEDIC